MGELIRHAPTAVIFVLGLATFGGAFALQSFNVKAVSEFQRAADSYAFLHRQAERQIGMEHRRAGLPIDQIASNELAARIVNLRANEATLVLLTPAVAGPCGRWRRGQRAHQPVIRASCSRVSGSRLTRRIHRRPVQSRLVNVSFLRCHRCRPSSSTARQGQYSSWLIRTRTSWLTCSRHC